MLPALSLFLLSPLFGEYLLGNLTVGDLALLPFLAVMYGAGAILIRETTRRAGHGSATMLVLGVAYALVEEGLIDQMLFNPQYFPGQAAESDTVVGFLGVDAWLTVAVVAMHAVWSTYIPIVLVESLAPSRRLRPWLGRLGLTVTAVVFVGGSAWLCWATYRETGFWASPARLTGTAIVVTALVVAAFRLPRSRAAGHPGANDQQAGHPDANDQQAGHLGANDQQAGRPGASSPQAANHRQDSPAGTGRLPRAWVAGLVALVSSSLFMLTESLPGWWEVAAALLIVAAFALLVARWSSRTGFGDRHRLALVAGGVLTYAWLGLTMEPESGPRTMTAQIGSLVIAAFVLALVALAFRRAAPAGGPAAAHDDVPERPTAGDSARTSPAHGEPTADSPSRRE